MAPPVTRPEFTYKHLPELHDITIECDYSKEVFAHKCILGARSEYYGGMFNSAGSESSAVIKMPLPANIMEAVVDFLCDSKGRNICVLQGAPNEALTLVHESSASKMEQNLDAMLREVSEFDSLHDVTCQVGDRRFPGHSFVPATGSKSLSKQLRSAKLQEEQEQVVDQVLQLLYTELCDLFHDGAKAASLATLELQEQQDIHKVSGDPGSKAKAGHDGICRVGDQRFPAHSCGLASGSESLSKQLRFGDTKGNDGRRYYLLVDPRPGEVPDYDNSASVQCTGAGRSTVHNRDVMYNILYSQHLKDEGMKGYLETAQGKEHGKDHVSEFHITIDAGQISLDITINFCMQFTCPNLPALLETKVLEQLEDSGFAQLDRCYQNSKGSAAKSATRGNTEARGAGLVGVVKGSTAVGTTRSNTKARGAGHFPVSKISFKSIIKCCVIADFF